MGTCLTVIKVVGTTSLGIYAGVIASNLSNYGIMSHVLKTATVATSEKATGLVLGKIKTTGALLASLGTIATGAFILAYTQAPRALKHPYLIYASLVAPLTSIIYLGLTRPHLHQYCELKKMKKQRQAERPASKKHKQEVISELDNSTYKDLGDVLTTSDEETPSAQTTSTGDEDSEVEQEVELHLAQKSLLDTLYSVHLGDHINVAISTLGFVVATVGLYGDH